MTGFSRHLTGKIQVQSLWVGLKISVPKMVPKSWFDCIRALFFTKKMGICFGREKTRMSYINYNIRGFARVRRVHFFTSSPSGHQRTSYRDSTFVYDGKRPGILTGNNKAANDGFSPYPLTGKNSRSSPSGFFRLSSMR